MAAFSPAIRVSSSVRSTAAQKRVVRSSSRSANRSRSAFHSKANKICFEKGPFGPFFVGVFRENVGARGKYSTTDAGLSSRPFGKTSPQHAITHFYTVASAATAFCGLLRSSMSIDIPTLFLVSTFVTSLRGIFLLVLWIQDRSARALGYWAAAYLIGGAAVGPVAGDAGAIAGKPLRYRQCLAVSVLRPDLERRTHISWPQDHALCPQPRVRLCG